MQAQTKIIDTTYYTFVYNLTYQPDSTNMEKLETEELILFTNGNKSKFVSKGTYLRDSLYSSFENEPADVSIALSKAQRLPKTKFAEIIIKNFKTNEFSFQENIFNENYQYKDSLNLFSWKIYGDKKTIGKYECQKATTVFRGREYIAWFTSDIAISDGPYKFNGLPGLILEIGDTKKHYMYTLLSSSQSKNVDLFKFNQKYTEVSQPEFITIKKNAYDRPLQKLEEMGISIHFDDQQKKRLIEKHKKRNNPIELTDE